MSTSNRTLRRHEIFQGNKVLTKLDCSDEDRVVAGHNQQALKAYKE
jgi:hypothetical protein